MDSHAPRPGGRWQNPEQRTCLLHDPSWQSSIIVSRLSRCLWFAAHSSSRGTAQGVSASSYCATHANTAPAGCEIIRIHQFQMATAGVADTQRKHPMKREGQWNHRVCFWVHCNVTPDYSSHVRNYTMKRLNQHDEMFNEKGPSPAVRLNSATFNHRRCSTNTGHRVAVKYRNQWFQWAEFWDDEVSNV